MGTTGAGREGVVLDLGGKGGVKKGDEHLEPDCEEYAKLDFSMSTFEHLSGMVQR